MLSLFIKIEIKIRRIFSFYIYGNLYLWNISVKDFFWICLEYYDT
jgi:hypothetical protein